MKPLLTAIAAIAMTASVSAKLPAPSDEAKAKAAETAAKTAHAGKTEAYLLCKAQDKVVARTSKTAKPTGKDSKTAAPASTCVDPGPFVYTPAGAPAAAASAATASAAASPDKPKK